MVVGGLGYSIRKKLDTRYLKDVSQLADRARQVERLKTEKSRAYKNNRKEEFACIDTEEYTSKWANEYVEEGKSMWTS